VAKGGRQPKLDDRKVRSKLLRFIGQGVSQKVACAAVGITVQTFHNRVKADPKFARAVKRAKAQQIAALTRLALKHAKTDPRTTLHLLACLDPRYRKPQEKQVKQVNHQHAHAHVHVGIDEQRSAIVALAARLGLGDVFEPDQESRPTTIDSPPARSGDGLPAPSGTSETPPDPDAAASRFPEPDVP
jgi:hypothetical protein